MIVGKNSGLGDLYKISTWSGKTIDCDTSFWSIFTPSCWNPFANDANISGNPSASAIEEALNSGNDPDAIIPCQSTLIPSLGVCDWMIYVGGAVGAILAFSAFSGRR
jgi:hypothetical protein